MVSVTLSRPSGGASVDIDLLQEGGDLILARDVGKPNVNYHETQALEAPRTQDYQNAHSTWTLSGILIGPNAYADAKTLAEDIIIRRSVDGQPLTLDLSNLSGRSTYDVVPASDSACKLTYVPGRLNVVGVQLTVPEVDTVTGEDPNDPPSQTAFNVGTPASGRGIRLTRRATSDSVDLTVENAVTRTVGRPSINLLPLPRLLPKGIDQNQVASDVWELSGVLLQNPQSDATTLEEDIIKPPHSQNWLELEFLGNEYGLAKYDVMPTSSQSLRTSISAGRKDIQDINKLELRTVYNRVDES